MMKKLLTLSAITLAAVASAQVSAAPLNLPGSGVITPVTGDCPALDNNITVQVSKDVYAVYNCTTVSFQAATCHGAGTNKTTTQTCDWDEVFDVDGNSQIPPVYEPNFTACGTDPTATAEDGSALKIEYTGRIGFKGTSGGGTVGQSELTETTCDTTTALTMVPDPA